MIVYAFQENEARSEHARGLLSKGGVTSVQVLNEFVAVARRKLDMSWAEVREALAALRVLCPSIVPLTVGTHEAAVRIAERYGYRIFDSLVIATALESGCGILYSEDMQDSQMIEGLKIQNPFRHGRHDD